jgi:hypothetical protein
MGTAAFEVLRQVVCVRGPACSDKPNLESNLLPNGSDKPNMESNLLTNGSDKPNLESNLLTNGSDKPNLESNLFTNGSNKNNLESNLFTNASDKPNIESSLFTMSRKQSLSSGRDAPDTLWNFPPPLRVLHATSPAPLARGVHEFHEPDIPYRSQGLNLYHNNIA